MYRYIISIPTPCDEILVAIDGKADQTVAYEETLTLDFEPGETVTVSMIHVNESDGEKGAYPDKLHFTADGKVPASTSGNKAPTITHIEKLDD